MKISKRRVEYSHLGGNLRLVSMTDEERKELAQQHNTEKWAISPNLYFVEFSSFNRNYRGYGSQKEAIYNSLRRLERLALEKKKSKFQKEMLSEIRKGINLYDIRQLELFD